MDIRLKKIFFTEIENGNLQGGLGSGWPSSSGIWEVHEASVLRLWKDSPPNVLFSHGMEWVYAQSPNRIRSCFVTFFWKSVLETTCISVALCYLVKCNMRSDPFSYCWTFFFSRGDHSTAGESCLCPCCMSDLHGPENPEYPEF